MLKINLGCGPNIFPGWLNVDRLDMQWYIDTIKDPEVDLSTWPEHQRKLAEAARVQPIEIAVHDMRQPLPWADDSVDAIYLGQVIEHLNPIYEVPKVLAECRRVLKPGGMLRITTPDLKEILRAFEAGDMQRFCGEQPEYYREATEDERLSLLLYGASGPDCTRDNYEGHFACYSPGSLRKTLYSSGLRDVRMQPTHHVPSFLFRDVVDCGMSHSMAVEATK